MVNLKCYVFQANCMILILTIINPNIGYAARQYTKEDILKLREEVREMFNHAYSGYLKYAYPYDELRPLSCDGVDTWGSYSLTLIDALDTLAVMGNYSEFRRVVDIVTSKANFDANINVSVFETNIRIVGGLLSAHLLSQRAGVELEPGWPCNGPLLRLAEDVAQRLIAAFDTTTGMPYGTVNLRHGVPPGETSITCTAGVGTFILEFGTLSRLTGDPIYEEVALNALHALYHHRSSIGLYGNHIDVMTGRWTAQDSGIGAGVDSYLEYLVKGALLVQRPELMAIFNEGRRAIDKHLRRNDWYLWVSMHKGQVTLPVFQSLEAYWPGVLSLIGDISGGMKSMHNYHQVWKQYGFTPEFYNIAQGQVGTNRESYPLRPELIESTMYLYRATKDPFLLDVGTDILRSIQHSARTRCGYATIKDCRDHSLENRMESFFLAETTKYLYLLFDPDNFIHNDGRHGTLHTLPSGRECILDAGGYIFNTEAHPLDPGALLCCSENFNEPQRYNRQVARGEKFTSFSEQNQKKRTQVDASSEHLQNGSEDPEQDLPSAFSDEDEVIMTAEESLDRLKESGAVDIVKIPPPSSKGKNGVHVFGQDQSSPPISPNMLQIIENVINNEVTNQIMINIEQHGKAAMSQEFLKEALKVIENAEKKFKKEMSIKIKKGKKKSKLAYIPQKSSIKDIFTAEKDFGHSSKNENQNVSVEEEEISKLGENIAETKGSKKIKERIILRKDSKLFNGNSLSNTSLEENHQDSSRIANNPSSKTEEFSDQNYDRRLFNLIKVQYYKTVRETILMETNMLSVFLNRCVENLEITKSVASIANNHELKAQFFTRRLDIMILATELLKSVRETGKLLQVKEPEEDITVELFKRLVELAIDEKTVGNFLEKYKGYINTVQKLIQDYNLDQTDDKTFSHEDNLNNESDTSESEEISNNSDNEESGNFFQTNNWKADDISYQVDDRERVAPVSTVDAGPLFTDKLRLKTETVVGLLPKSLVSSETSFNPQVLLERIRSSPKYHHNSTWTTQYELLTCLPQPYFTRIMLSGEFYND